MDAPIEDTNTSAIHINKPVITRGYNIVCELQSSFLDTKQKPRNLLDYDLATGRSSEGTPERRTLVCCYMEYWEVTISYYSSYYSQYYNLVARD